MSMYFLLFSKCRMYSTVDTVLYFHLLYRLRNYLPYIFVNSFNPPRVQFTRHYALRDKAEKNVIRQNDFTLHH